MKNFLICILGSLLMIGAFLSRPSEESYRNFINQRLKEAGIATSTQGAEAVTQGCKFKDCWLWSTIEINGKIAYAGVFSRWFPVPERAGSGS